VFYSQEWILRCRVLIIASFVLISAALAACGVRGDIGGIAPILLFNGTGTSPGDVAAVETILNRNHLNSLLSG
jgi:hypothetical protein